MASHHPNMTAEEIKKANIKRILQVAGILAIITGIEFALALLWPKTAGRTVLNVLFLVLTVFKAFYIVADFMHLRHEVKALMLSIILPIAFIVWLVIALIVEGDAILGM